MAQSRVHLYLTYPIIFQRTYSQTRQNSCTKLLGIEPISKKLPFLYHPRGPLNHTTAALPQRPLTRLTSSSRTQSGGRGASHRHAPMKVVGNKGPTCSSQRTFLLAPMRNPTMGNLVSYFFHYLAFCNDRYFKHAHMYTEQNKKELTGDISRGFSRTTNAGPVQSTPNRKYFAVPHILLTILSRLFQFILNSNRMFPVT